MDKGCSKEAPAAGSLMQCARQCSRDDSCIGASLDDTGKCFLQQQCHENPICTEEDSNPRYVSRYCVNGTWDFSSQSCKCAYGFHGDRCEHYPRICRDLITSGYKRGGYRVYIDPIQDGKNPVLPFCFISPPSLVQVRILKNSGQQPFNKSWDEYAKGFYMDGFHYWSGLDALHVLTDNGCNTIHVKFQSRDKFTRTFNKFMVSSGSDKYTFSYKGNHYEKKKNAYDVLDCLSSLKNTPFSTWDKDHDGDDQENCASRAGSGWWYSGCNSPCNMLGFGSNHRDTSASHQLMSLGSKDMSQVPSDTLFTISLEC